MTNIDLIHALNSIGAVKTGQFTLKSGATSPIYIDLRLIISFPKLLQSIAELLWQRTTTQSFDLVCGVPYTALPIATAMSLNHQVPMVMRRKEKKDYGTKNQIEGVFKAGQNCLIIEDIITTGASIIETVNDLRAAGLTVTHVATIIDREQGGQQNLQQNDLTYTSLLNLQDILNTLEIVI